MGDNGKVEQIVFKAVLEDKIVKVYFGTNFVPILTMALKLTEMEIENLIAETQENQNKVAIPKVQISQSVLDKLRGR